MSQHVKIAYMKVIILAGGSGTRLWPLSRENYPKQFLKIFGDKSLLLMTYERALKLANHEDIVIISHQDYKNHIVNDLYPYTGYSLVLEPQRKNTGPAVALGLLYIRDVLKASLEEEVLILASDHYIEPQDRFVEYMHFGKLVAKDGYVVAFGIQPSSPDVNFGYIKAGNEIKAEGELKAYAIKRFVEKPPIQTARAFLEEGGYFWDSGNFFLRLDVGLEEFETNAQEIGQHMKKGYAEFLKAYHQLPDIAFDYIEMEKTKRGAVIPMDITWSDVGFFDGLYRLLQKEDSNNACVGDVFCLDTEGSLVLSSDRLLCTVGLKDTLIVETKDSVLVMKKDGSAKVKELVKLLKESKRREVIENIEKNEAWGKSILLEEGQGYSVHKLILYPGKRISKRMHMHHNRVWMMLKGTLYIKFNELDFYFTPGESKYVKRTEAYSMENPGFIPAELLEIRMGEYIDDGDVILLEDEG